MPKKTKTQTQPESINIMESLLQTGGPALLKKGNELDAKIISLSRKAVLFDVGAKAYAVLGDKEVKEISTYLPYLNVGDPVHVRVISEESKEGFPVVSMSKFFEKGKWEIVKDKKEKEEEIEVVCGEYGKGGVFIDFMGIRGVIPKIQLTEDFLDEPSKLDGQKIKVKVLEVDQTKNRLVVSQKASALKISQKELHERFEAIKDNEEYEAKVLGVSEFGIFCEVNGVEGLIHISEISWEKVTDATSYVRQGETIKVLVVEKNEGDLKLNLSLKRLMKDPWDEIEEKYPKDKEIQGEIIRKERYGYFVRLEPGVEGLIHVSKLSGEETLEIGDKVKVFVERISKKDRKMSLLLPQTEKPILYR
ncbi:S1 RNA-binding domain-containing protein [Candidatus Roizmanbacteria bacterium]|nr:S1 RNA-binding domain-containing protein [Candidatus Roizmanbacteria bacterium]